MDKSSWQELARHLQLRWPQSNHVKHVRLIEEQTDCPTFDPYGIGFFAIAIAKPESFTATSEIKRA